jgi:hypothetical protein
VISDLSRLAAQLVELIKMQELDKARQLVQDARRAGAGSDFRARRQTVHELTLAIADAKRQRARLFLAVDALPDSQRLFARAEVENICRSLFDAEIASLTTRKRQLSNPARQADC